MKVSIISFGIIGHDGPLHELYEVSKKIGKCCVLAFTLSNDSIMPYYIHISDSNERYTFVKFTQHVIMSLKMIFHEKPNILIIDDFTATFVGFLVSIICPSIFIVQYSRELYIRKRMPGFGNVFLWFERKLYRRADLIVCCNDQRAEIMHKEFCLNKAPIVFENIRVIDAEYDKSVLDKKYRDFFNSKIKLVDSGGCSLSRGTIKIVRAMKCFEDFSLYIIGHGSEYDYSKVCEILESELITNVHILNRVPLAELKYIIDHCDIGIVAYHQNDLNNIYCASGKAYEYMAEGLPLVTTKNVPLRNLCDKYNVGCSDDSFSDAIAKVANNMSYYKENVAQYMKKISVNNNRSKFASCIINAYEDRDDK